MRRAKCRGIDYDAFFGLRDKLTALQAAKAISICKQCPVSNYCLEFALDGREKWGVWGGTTRKTRKLIWQLMDNGDVTLVQVLAAYAEGRGEDIFFDPSEEEDDESD
jgi:WhiB family redox-sensing transcriptional regulator